MVEGTRKATRPGTIRPLNAPLPLTVLVDRAGRPRAVTSGHLLRVSSITDRWRVDEGWWRGPGVSRLYFEVLLEDGHRLTLFRDLGTGRWYRQAYD